MWGQSGFFLIFFQSKRPDVAFYYHHPVYRYLLGDHAGLVYSGMVEGKGLTFT